ncbi:hypothetical protein [Vibrio ichthyoenteri]|uniref:hypothetical protein n=1 Tax=Vibrio ichthyoenteri TaxID=142461 RepID=UPI000586B96F|nr:hypothetical protein [Vibrio ichthyoenteri]
MKKNKLILLPLIAIGLSSPLVASDADCSIWLCLPTGFPSGCGDAKKAFKDRIKKFKPPLPNLASCIVSSPDYPTVADKDPSTMSYREGVAAKMPNGSYIDGTSCVHYVDSGGQDHQLIWKPYGCTGTWHYLDTLMDGNQYGQRHYYQR